MVYLFLMTGCTATSLATPTPTPQHNPGPAEQIVLPAISPTPSGENTARPSLPDKNLSTPELIDAAYQQKEITAGQRWLYLAYAIYDYQALPVEYRSQVRWDATLYLRDLKNATASPESMCALEPEVQAELRRLLSGSASCPP
jgi:hypothetical protein